MAISEAKVKIVVDNYFPKECDVNTSIREAFEKGFRLGIKKSATAADVRPVVRGEWLAAPILDDMCYQHYSCSVCKRVEAIPHGYDVKKELPFCHCGADMRKETEE